MTLPVARIVVATSGSGASRHATHTAARLASAFAAELTIVHAVAARQYRTGRLTPTLPIARQLEDPYASLVLLDAQRLASAQGAAVRPVLIAGEAAAAVVAVAGRLVADLLVVGAKPRRGPTAVLGKTRRWIQAHAPCPVLVVAAGEIAPRPGLASRSWSRQGRGTSRRPAAAGITVEAAGAMSRSDRIGLDG